MSLPAGVGSGSVSLFLPLGEAVKAPGGRTLMPRPKGGRGKLTHYPGLRGVLMDIEGTTTAIAFVYEVLFPYAAVRLAETCARRAAEPEVAWAIARLREG